MRLLAGDQFTRDDFDFCVLNVDLKKKKVQHPDLDLSIYDESRLDS